MQRIIVSCFLIILSIVPAHSRGEFRVGGDEGNPWPNLLSEEGAGEYWLFDAEGQLVSTESVGITPHGVAADTLIDFADNAIGPRFIDPSVNLTLIDPNASDINTLLPYTGGQIQTTDGCSARDDQIRAVKKQFDGDFTTAHFRRFTPGQGIFSGGTIIAGVTGEGWKNSVVIDFRTAVPVNRIRFLPRLGQEDDILLIEELTEPKPPLEAFGEDSFAANFLAWYELRKGDNTVRFANSPCDRVSRVTKGLRWVRNQDPALTVIESNRENLDPVVELRFPTESIRYITAQAFPLRRLGGRRIRGVRRGLCRADCPRHADPRLWPADQLGQNSLGRRRARGHPHRGPHPHRQLAGPKPLLRRKHQRRYPPDYLGCVRKTRPVRPVCPPCTIPTIGASGRRPTILPRVCATATHRLRRGATVRRFLSPGPRPLHPTRLSPVFHLYHCASHPLIHDPIRRCTGCPRNPRRGCGPLPSIPSRPREFTYVVRPEFSAEDTGFDRLEIRTHAQVQSVSAVKRDGTELDLNEFVPDIQADRLVVSFPPPARRRGQL